MPVPYDSICCTYHQLKYSTPNRSKKTRATQRAYLSVIGGFVVVVFVCVCLVWGCCWVWGFVLGGGQENEPKAEKFRQIERQD